MNVNVRTDLIHALFNDHENVTDRQLKAAATILLVGIGKSELRNDALRAAGQYLQNLVKDHNSTTTAEQSAASPSTIGNPRVTTPSTPSNIAACKHERLQNCCNVCLGDTTNHCSARDPAILQWCPDCPLRRLT